MSVDESPRRRPEPEGPVPEIDTEAVGDRDPEAQERADQPDRLRRVVVPLANPRTAALLMTIARATLDPEDGELLAVTIATDDAQAESTAGDVERIRDALEASFGSEHGIEVQRRGAPAIARGILDFVRECSPDLVVMGMDGDADGRSFGAVADAVIESVHCAVLAIRPSDELGIERITVGIDGSDEAQEALQLAVLASAGMSVPLLAIHVRDPDMSRSFAQAVLARAADVVPEWLDADGRVVEDMHGGGGITAPSRPTDVLFIASPQRTGIARLAAGGGTLDLTLQREQAHVAVLSHRIATTRPSRLRSWLRTLHPTLTSLEKESVQWRSAASAPLSTDFMILLGVSAVLASLGLLQNSVAVVIGAMLVAPLLGPLSAASTALTTARIDVLGRALFTLLVGIAGSVVLSLAVGAVVPIDSPTDEMLARGSPSLIDLGVAVAAGVVGAYATARKEIPAALAGVAIAAALVPPICTTGLALGLRDLDLATGALLLFVVNTVSVVLIGAVVLWWMGLRPAADRGVQAGWVAALTATVLAFLVVVAGLDAFGDAQRARSTSVDLEEAFEDAEVVAVTTEGKDPLTVTAVLRTTDSITPSEVRAARSRLEADLDREVILRVVEHRIVTAD